MLTFGSLFSGIGGLDLGLVRAGWQSGWMVEIDEFCQRVLKSKFPDVPLHGDVKECGAANLSPVDLICGGFPCQPVSLAGKMGGNADDRWLWPEFRRILSELKPRFALIENVPGLLTVQDGQRMSEVMAGLADLGYDAEWQTIPAAAFGAPHLRFRVYVIAHPRVSAPHPQGAFARFSDGGWLSMQADLFAGEQPLAGTWPNAGLIRSGWVHAAEPLVERSVEGLPWPPVTDGFLVDRDGYGIELSLPYSRSSDPTWPTASSRDWKDTPGMATVGPDGRDRTDQLARRVYATDRLIFPTPRADKTTDEDEERWMKRHESGDVATPPLALAARMFPTPRAQDGIERRNQKTMERIYDEGGDLTLTTKVKVEGKRGLLPTPAAKEPGWKNLDIVDVDGNPPEHANQRFYDRNTGRHVQKGLEQVSRMFPTPRSSDMNSPGVHGHGGQDLRTVVQMLWRTPQARDGDPRGPQSPERRLEGGHSVGLPDQVRWPTPAAADGDRTSDTYPGNHNPTLQGAARRWPTPTVHGNDNRKGASEHSGDGLGTRVRKWPTPQAQDGDLAGGLQSRIDGRQATLPAAVKMPFPTPTSSMETMQDMEQARFSGSSGDRPEYRNAWPTPRGSDQGVGLIGGTGNLEQMRRKNEAGEITDEELKGMTPGGGGQLNPYWVSLLMGFPETWLDTPPERLLPDEEPHFRFVPIADGPADRVLVGPVFGSSLCAGCAMELGADDVALLLTPAPCARCWTSGTWESGIERLAKNIPERRNRLRALGNAVVPQAAEWLGWRIKTRLYLFEEPGLA